MKASRFSDAQNLRRVLAWLRMTLHILLIALDRISVIPIALNPAS
jgi:hypothetical protein